MRSKSGGHSSSSTKTRIHPTDGIAALGLATGILLYCAACTPPPQFVAVVESDGGGIALLDSDLSPVGTLTTGSVGADRRVITAAFSNGGSVVYVADSGQANSVAALRRHDGVTIDRIDLPTGLVARSLKPLPDGKTLLISRQSTEESSNGGGLSFHATTELTTETSLELCEGRPDGITAMRSGERAYIRCAGTALKIVEVDLQLRRLVRTVDHGLPEPCGHGDIALSRTDSFLFATCPESGLLIYLDRLTLEQRASISVGVGASLLAVSPTGPRALVVRELSAEIVLVDLMNRTIEARLSLPGTPRTVAVTGDGARGLVATDDDTVGVVLALDMANLEQIATVRGLGGRGITSWPGASSPTVAWR